jgi:transcriptional regulator with XRE-family HTH domain
MSTDSEVSHLWAVVQEWLELLPYPPNQSKLAQRLGVSRSAVSEWKRGGSSPGATHLRALAKEMQTVFGPDAYPRLLEAVNQDQGYLPSTVPAKAARSGRNDGRRQRKLQDSAAEASQDSGDHEPA